VVDLSQVFSAVPRPFKHDRLPAADLKRMRETLVQAGFKWNDSPEAADKLKKLREMYEPYLYSLSDFFFADVPPWILSKEAVDNWRTSAWGRVAGLSGAGGEEVPLDAHRDR
jgi:hypothetical protein